MVDEQGLYFYPYSNICRTQKIPGKYYLMIINKKYPENRSEGCADHAGDPGVRIAGSVSPTPGEHHLPERPVTGLPGSRPGMIAKAIIQCVSPRVYRKFRHVPEFSIITLWDSIMVLEYDQAYCGDITCRSATAVEQRSTRKRPGVPNAEQKLKQERENSQKQELQGGGSKDPNTHYSSCSSPTRWRGAVRHQ